MFYQQFLECKAEAEHITQCCLCHTSQQKTVTVCGVHKSSAQGNQGFAKTSSRTAQMLHRFQIFVKWNHHQLGHSRQSQHISSPAADAAKPQRSHINLCCSYCSFPRAAAAATPTTRPTEGPRKADSRGTASAGAAWQQR